MIKYNNGLENYKIELISTEVFQHGPKIRYLSSCRIEYLSNKIEISFDPEDKFLAYRIIEIMLNRLEPEDYIILQNKKKTNFIEIVENEQIDLITIIYINENKLELELSTLIFPQVENKPGDYYMIKELKKG